jgi:hypothetical protein
MTMKWIGLWLFLSLAFGLLSACAPAGQIEEVNNPGVTQESAATPTVRPGLVVVPTETSTEDQPAAVAPAQPGAFDEVIAPLVQQAQDDLVKRIGASLDQITVVSMNEVVWPDGSLGCAQPGQAYTQATTPGYQIILSYRGQEYDYHTDSNYAFLCENAVPAAGITKNIAPEVKLVNLAVNDLLQRLGISKDRIIPQPLIPKKWDDTSLGCPQVGQTYTPGEVKGYEIVLKVKDQNNQEKKYTYHSDLERVVYCEQP